MAMCTCTCKIMKRKGHSTVVKPIVTLFAPLSPLLNTSCRSLSSATVSSALWAPFVVAVVFVTGPRTPVLFSSDKVPPVAVVFDGCQPYFLRFEHHERCHINTFFGGEGHMHAVDAYFWIYGI